MEFRLKYEGPLKSFQQATIKDKHKLRKAFHPQLKNLFDKSALAKYIYPETEESFIKEVGKFQFFNLVSTQIGLIAELDMILMRPEEPGKMIASGDIDNRLKTLFDALRYPDKEQEIPSREIPNRDEKPFFCLLEDDALVSSIKITTDRLLEDKDPSYAFLLIHVNVKPARHVPKTWRHLEFL